MERTSPESRREGKSSLEEPSGSGAPARSGPPARGGSPSGEAQAETAPAPLPALQVLVIYHDGRELLEACCRSLLPPRGSAAGPGGGGRAESEGGPGGGAQGGAGGPPRGAGDRADARDAAAGGTRGYRVAVVDSGSPDRAAEEISSRFPGLETLRVRNRGYAAAVNAGLLAFPAAHHFILNSDTEVEPRAVEALLDFMEAHPRCGAVSPAEVDSRGFPQLIGGCFPTVLGEVRRARLQARAERGEPLPAGARGGPPRPARVDWISGSSMLVRSRAVEEAGGMDEGYFLYFEDVDWCRAMAAAGWEVWYLPAVRILHHRGRSAGKDPERSRLWFQESRFRYWRKWKGRASFEALRASVRLKLWLESLARRRAGRERDGEARRKLLDLVREARYRP